VFGELIFYTFKGVKHCEDRNASIVEILGGVRAEDKRFDVTAQFHHVWFMGESTKPC